MKEREPQPIISYRISCQDCAFTFTARLSDDAVDAEARRRFFQDVSDGHEYFTGHTMNQPEIIYEGKSL